MIVGTGIIYLLGVAWLSQLIGFDKACPVWPDTFYLWRYTGWLSQLYLFHLCEAGCKAHSEKIKPVWNDRKKALEQRLFYVPKTR